MKPIARFPEEVSQKLRGVICDIDDTLTHEEKLVPEAFAALSRLQQAGLRVIPITGRPGGWADQIIRLWPVDGVVGENGGLWCHMRDGKLIRTYLQDEQTRWENKDRLRKLGEKILQAVPGTALASDQSYRDLDLAIDFCEDVPPLGEREIDQIVALFLQEGATAKVSSIHVNGWYGNFDKLTGCRRLFHEAFNESLDDIKNHYVYIGDSANDEPMFEYFPHSVGVANVRGFLHRMSAHPKYICEQEGGYGFSELVDQLLNQRREL